MKTRHKLNVSVWCAVALSVGCCLLASDRVDGQRNTGRPTVAEAQLFLKRAEARLLDLSVEAERANWVQSTFITQDTESLAALADRRLISATADLAKQSVRFDPLSLPRDLRRKLNLLKLSLTLAAPKDAKQSQELTETVASLEGDFGKGKSCTEGDANCLSLEDLNPVFANSRDPKELLRHWVGWHKIAPPMRERFIRYVTLANQGARELGFADTGAMWRSKYDMPPADFAKELDRLWEQVKPLYTALHAYVRNRLRETYGPEIVPEKGPIPAHLLGNMWAQSWENIYPIVAPKDSDPGYDLTEILKSRNINAKQMVQFGEAFFISLGFAPLPKTFWETSLFLKPKDREVVCHASASDIDFSNDLRIKMCIDITAEDFSVIHHELGHNFYQRAYSQQPFLFRDSANDGFHEAVGDTIALSVTPEYLVKLGFLTAAPDQSKDIGLLLRTALEKVAFLPFGLLIDQWRWKVFSGSVSPERYNESWWQLRLKYQGISPPIARSERDFDPAAKYHVAANVPYARYFLAHILQFQFHQALARISGCREPLHRCSIYESREAGQHLEKVLAMGCSRPWPDVLEALAGTRQMDASALLEYFKPLQKWLDEQNRGKPVGW
jgi:peptidyl-dipeptidase A